MTPFEETFEPLDFPTHIQIQTTSACGAACTICPHPTESPKWGNGLMHAELFEHIVEQLAVEPVNYVSPYLMADPLSDRQIFDRIAQLREALPSAHLEVSTTGLYLAPRIAERLLAAPLSELRISSHGISAEEYARTMPGVNFLKAMGHIDGFIAGWRDTEPYPLSIVCLWGLWSPEREQAIAAYWEERGVALSRWRVVSRADQVDLTVFGETSPDPTPYHAGVAEPPFRCRFDRDRQWMHILSDGRVTMCCMDYRQEVIVGDANRQSLREIWHGEAMQAIRAAVRGDVASPDSFLCKRCEWHVSESVMRRQDPAGVTAGAPAV